MGVGCVFSWNMGSLPFSTIHLINVPAGFFKKH